MKGWQDVAVPDLMAHLPRDRRGYPIPYVVARDKAGEPLFTINDSEITQKQAAECRCGICGSVIELEGFYFVGGPASAFHPQGGFYIDGPMHDECSAYALTVCPYLAAPRYTGRLDEKPTIKNGVDFHVLKDQTMLPGRPLVFVRVRALDYSMSWPRSPHGESYFLPVSGVPSEVPGDRSAPSTRFFDYDVWQHGKPILDEQEGINLIRQGLAAVAAQTPKKPRLFRPDGSALQPVADVD